MNIYIVVDQVNERNEFFPSLDKDKAVDFVFQQFEKYGKEISKENIRETIEYYRKYGNYMWVHVKQGVHLHSYSIMELPVIE